jgi:hypothetical protein
MDPLLGLLGDHRPDVRVRLVAWTEIKTSVNPDPGSGAFLTPGSGIRDGKNPGPGSGIIFENLGSVFFLVKKLFDADPDPRSCQPWIRDLKKSDPG